MRMLIVLIFLSLAEFTGLQGMDVGMMRIPHSGIQPQVQVDGSGKLHLVYYAGEAAAGDLFYVALDRENGSWSDPVRVNSTPQSAVAGGTIRGAHMSLGKNDRVHVSWFGSARVAPKTPEGQHPQAPLMVTRMNDSRDGFEPERNVMTWTKDLDGGGSIAADKEGNVYVAWHGRGHSRLKGEMGRGIFLATSRDKGKTFEREIQVREAPPGSCACCGMRVAIHPDGQLHIVYRGLQNEVRPMVDLWSADGGNTFEKVIFNPWRIKACPMSSVNLLPIGNELLIATEQEQSIKLNIRSQNDLSMRQFPEHPTLWNGKHPSAAADPDGNLLLTWSEGAGWAQGGTLRWVILDKTGTEIAQNPNEDQPAIPVWSFPKALYFNQGFRIIF